MCGVEPAQEQQLADLGLHRYRRRLGRSGVQPPQPCHPDLVVSDQQAVQLGPALLGQQVRQSVVGFPFRSGSRRGDPLDQPHHVRPDYLGGAQVLARQLEQQRRGVVLHRPSQQKLLQLLVPQRPREPPFRILQHQPQMVGAGLLPFPIPGQHARTEVQLVGQPSHRCRRCGRDVIGDEPQPRQGAQLHRQAEALPWRTPTARVDERAIRRGQREEPDQLIAGDLRKAAQLDQFLLGEHPSRYPTTPPPLTACRRFPATLDSR